MYFLAKYGVQTDIEFAMVKRGVVDLAATADWTPATGDTKIIKDGANATNSTNNPAAIGGTGSVGWKLTLTATELQCARLQIQIVDSATKAVEDQFITVYTFGNTAAKFPFDFSDLVRGGLTALPNASAEAVGGLFTRGSGAGQINQLSNGQLDANVVGIEGSDPTNQIRDSVVSDATRFAGSNIDTSISSRASQTSLNTVDDFIDTEIADIQSRLPAALDNGKMNSHVASLGNNVITDAVIASDVDGYTAKIWIIRDGSTTDRYAVRWFKNLVPITSGITDATIEVIKGSDGSSLISSTALTDIGSHRFKKDEGTNKMISGQIYFAVVSAFIDGLTRTFEQQVGRDST